MFINVKALDWNMGNQYQYLQAMISIKEKITTIYTKKKDANFDKYVNAYERR